MTGRPNVGPFRGASRLPVVPPEHRDWVEDAAFGLRQRLLHGGYPVDGDPDAVLPVFAERETASVLDLAIELLLEEDA